MLGRRWLTALAGYIKRTHFLHRSRGCQTIGEQEPTAQVGIIQANECHLFLIDVGGHHCGHMALFMKIVVAHVRQFIGKTVAA